MPKTEQTSNAMAITFVLALAAYLIGAPIAALVLQAWWPLGLGLGLFCGFVCILVAISLVKIQREGAQSKPQADQPTLEQAVNDAITERAAESLARQMREDQQDQ